MTTDSIGARLAHVAQRAPERVAIIEGTTRVSFRELDARTSAIARRIVAIAGETQGVVCLLFETKLRAIVAILGACKSGRAYVPLDVGDPEARLQFIVRDSEPVVLLTERAVEDRARRIAPAGVTVIAVESSDAGEAPLPEVRAETPAYVLYTSGSTGQPKGVVQTHANALVYADTYARTVGVGPGDRLSLLNPLSFAAANNQVLRGLLSGATLCAYDLRRDAIEGVTDWCDRERITLLHAAPSVFRAVFGPLAPERLLPHLRAVHLGGESVYASDVELFRRHTLAHCVLVNQLASTEAGFVAQNIIGHRGPWVARGLVPVGRVLEGVRVEIRREDGSVAPAGEAGELVVCGAHLTPGYWRRPELDAATFGPDPEHPGWRRYRSGDVGVLDEAGNLRVLGRKGSRVKIRGHTVDLIEVEAALAACADVAQAAVVAAGDESQMQPVRAIAYVVLRGTASGAPASIRRDLAGRLPAYMLPSVIVCTDSLPLGAGGKVNRRALAQRAPEAVVTERAVTPVRDDVERDVASVFEQLLQVGPVGRDGDFFLLGGDSLSAIELQMRLRDVHDVHVGNFHADATVAGIASEIRRARAERDATPQPLPVLVPLWQHGTQPPLFIVHGRHGQAFVAPHFMHLLGDDQPVWAFQARGLDGLREPHVTVEDMAAEYLAEMRRVRSHGPYFLGALCAGAYVAIVMARALRACAENVLPLLLLDPPNSVATGGYTHLTAEQFEGKMRARRARGVTAGPVDDAPYMNALVRTAMAFERAIANHRPEPYDGPAYVLASRQRLQGTDPFALRKVLVGRMKRYEVGSTHRDALDPRNPVFGAALQRCIGLIREAARMHRA